MMVSLKCLRKCVISNKELRYDLEKGIIIDVPKEHVKTLLRTGLVELVEKTNN